jgi:predicted transcriptional regulator
MTEGNVLYIGIASREAIKKRTIAIAKGVMRPEPTDPRVWFSSFESLAKVLSEKNMLLLETIRRGKPRSLAELAKISGRAVPNLSRTLHNMERFGLVEFKEEGHRKVPTVRYERVNLDVALDGDEEPPQAA